MHSTTCATALQEQLEDTIIHFGDKENTQTLLDSLVNG